MSQTHKTEVIEWQKTTVSSLVRSQLKLLCKFFRADVLKECVGILSTDRPIKHVVWMSHSPTSFVCVNITLPLLRALCSQSNFLSILFSVTLMSGTSIAAQTAAEAVL